MNISRPLAVLALFFASGATSLVYQVVWTRSLSLTFGITTHAVAAVLCAFMAGLALGSFVVSRWSHRIANPLAAYGILELLIGVFALFFPWLQAWITELYVATFRSSGGAPAGITRFLLASLCLLVPSSFMGATFPLFVQAFVRSPKRIGVSVGLVYALNTLGAVAGTLLAGFLLVDRLGISGATYVAVAGNVLVTIGALALSRGANGPAVAPVAAATTAAPAVAVVLLGRPMILVAIGASGFAALAYEILWTRTLTFFVHNSTYAFSGMLAVFLTGLALGSLLVGLVLDRLSRKSLVFLFAMLEVAIGASAVLSVHVATRLPEFVATWYPRLLGRMTITSWGDATILALLQCALVVFTPTVLMGATFPVAGRLYLDDPAEAARRIGEVYSANTLGSILGSLLGGLVLIDLVGGVAPAFLAVILLNLGIGVAIACSGSTGALRRITVAGCACAAALAAIVVLPAGVFRKVFEDRYGEIAFYKEGVTDTTLVARAPEEGNRKPFLFYGDGRGVAGVATFQENRMSGHLPLLLHGAPRRVLSICYGVGNTLGAMTRHKDVERLDCVELSPNVRETSRFFTERNHDPLSDPRVELIIQDGRNFLLATDRRYDVIGLEPPEIHTSGVVNLYTEEFYELCRDHLTDSGVLIQWFNIGVTPEAVARMLVKAVDSVFPHTTLWQAPQYYSWLVVGTMRPLAIDYGRLASRMAREDVRQDLVEAAIGEPTELLSWLVLTEPGVDRFVAGVPVITDDRTIVDFLAPRSAVALFGGMHYSSAYKDWSHYVQTGEDPRAAFRERMANFRLSHELRESPAPMLVGLPQDAGERERVLADLAQRVARKAEANRKLSDDSEVGKK